MKYVLLTALVALMMGCTAPGMGNPTCDGIGEDLNAQIGDGFMLVRTTSPKSGGVEIGSCNFFNSEDSVAITYMNAPEYEEKSNEERKGIISEIDIYKESTERKFVEGDGYVYAYLEGEREGVPMQHVVLSKGAKLISVSFILLHEEDFESEEDLLAIANKVSERV